MAPKGMGWTVEYGYRPGRASGVGRRASGVGRRASPSRVQAASLSINNLLPFAHLGVAKTVTGVPRRA